MKIDKYKILRAPAILFLLLFFNLVLLDRSLAAENPVISTDFNNEIAPISAQIFGQGLEIPYLKSLWNKDTGFDQEKINAARAMGFTNVRFGGNTCKQFNWKEASVSGFTSQGTTYYESIDQWAQYAALLGDVPPTICVNLRLTPQDSADLVRYANIDHNYKIKNWEMGNEEYAVDQYAKYARAIDFVNDARTHCQAMKAVDPTIRCGIHSGLAAVSPDWSNEALFSAVQPEDFDFLVDHNYQPNGYFNYLPIYSSATKVDQTLDLESGAYKIGFHSIGQQAPLIADPIPTLQVCLGSTCQLVDITGTSSDWYYYVTADFTFATATSTKLKMEIFDDYYDFATQQDKNIFLADIRVVNSDGSIRQAIELVDRQAWTYSFLASNLATEDNLDNLKSVMLLHRLDLPIYETEYGWQYGGIAYPEAGKQYDWRSGLFDALHLQSLINKRIQQANLWTDPSINNWNYYTDDEKGKIYWPRFYAFKLMKEKTGDTQVKVETLNMPTYDALAFTTPARASVPFLSIIASKKGDKNYLNVINRAQDQAITATIKPNSAFSKIVAYEIAPTSIEAHPYRDDEYKDNIAITETALTVTGDFAYSFKPFSITTFEFFPPDLTAPVLTNGLPSGQLPAGTIQTTLQLSTNEDATCRYSTQAGLSFASSTTAFNTTGSTTHSSVINGLSSGGAYTYYVRCGDTVGNSNTDDHIIAFSIAQPAPVIISGGGGGGGGGGSSATVDTTAPEKPTQFTASRKAGTITLSWINPTVADFNKVIIVRDIKSISDTISGKALKNNGTIVYEDKGKIYEDKNSLDSIKYYYAIAAFDQAGNYSLPTVLAVPLAGEENIKLSILAEKVQVLGTEHVDYSGYKSLYGLTSELASAISQNEAELIASQTERSILSPANRKLYEKIMINAAGLATTTRIAVAYFIQTGTPTTLVLGAGERAGVLNSYISAYGYFPETIAQWQDIIKIANGRWPSQTSQTAETKGALQFKMIYLKNPDKNNSHDNTAVKIIAYGLRPASRNTNSEKAAIISFKNIFKQDPISATDWDVVRSITYSGSKR